MSNRSEELFKEALKFIPGGVNSPVRAFKSVGGAPVFIDHAEGSRIYDVEGRAYIDYIGSWGPMIVGHSHPRVVEALKKALDKGTSFGAPTELETELAQRVIEAVPSVEMVRMVNSGTEATMSAIRVARGYTDGTRSSSSRGATTAMPTGSSSRPVPAPPLSAFPRVPASPRITPGTP